MNYKEYHTQRRLHVFIDRETLKENINPDLTISTVDRDKNIVIELQGYNRGVSDFVKNTKERYKDKEGTLLITIEKTPIFPRVGSLFIFNR
jgi:hypothetical protein